MVGLARGLRPSGYRRVWLARDVVAGVVLSTLLVPQGMAYAELAWAPWYIADADDKKRARLNIISHLLSQVPYKPLAHRDIKLPKRQPPRGYLQPDLPLRHIPAPF
jgi:hypothetical protein